MRFSLTQKIILFFFIGFVFISALLFVLYQKIQNEPMNLWSGPWPEADCGIVLTGATGRVREGFEYLAQKKINKLIVSGVNKSSKLEEIFPYLDFYPDVNPNDIYLEKRSETTFGNAQQSLIFVEALGCQDVVLMTSQIHMARSYEIFKNTFPDQFTIYKLSLPNARSEKTILGFFIEAQKSFFYLAFRLVKLF
jgi:uncharacterized SAM-binding protein YcdF (DUF218 family)